MKPKKTAAKCVASISSRRRCKIFATRCACFGRAPGFAAVTVLTLGLGIAANTAIFSLLTALALGDKVVSHPEQLVRFGAYSPDDRDPDDPYTAICLPMFQELSRDQNV